MKDLLGVLLHSASAGLYDQAMKIIFVFIIVFVAGALLFFFGFTDAGKKLLKSIRRTGVSKRKLY